MDVAIHPEIINRNKYKMIRWGSQIIKVELVQSSSATISTFSFANGKFVKTDAIKVEETENSIHDLTQLHDAQLSSSDDGRTLLIFAFSTYIACDASVSLHTVTYDLFTRTARLYSHRSSSDVEPTEEVEAAIFPGCRTVFLLPKARIIYLCVETRGRFKYISPIKTKFRHAKLIKQVGASSWLRSASHSRFLPPILMSCQLETAQATEKLNEEYPLDKTDGVMEDQAEDRTLIWKLASKFQVSSNQAIRSQQSSYRQVNIQNAFQSSSYNSVVEVVDSVKMAGSLPQLVHVNVFHEAITRPIYLVVTTMAGEQEYSLISTSSEIVLVQCGSIQASLPLDSPTTNALMIPTESGTSHFYAFQLSNYSIMLVAISTLGGTLRMSNVTPDHLYAKHALVWNENGFNKLMLIDSPNSISEYYVTWKEDELGSWRLININESTSSAAAAFPTISNSYSSISPLVQAFEAKVCTAEASITEISERIANKAHFVNHAASLLSRLSVSHPYGTPTQGSTSPAEIEKRYRSMASDVTFDLVGNRFGTPLRGEMLIVPSTPSNIAVLHSYVQLYESKYFIQLHIKNEGFETEFCKGICLATPNSTCEAATTDCIIALKPRQVAMVTCSLQFQADQTMDGATLCFLDIARVSPTSASAWVFCGHIYLGLSFDQQLSSYPFNESVALLPLPPQDSQHCLDKLKKILTACLQHSNHQSIWSSNDKSTIVKLLSSKDMPVVTVSSYSEEIIQRILNLINSSSGYSLQPNPVSQSRMEWLNNLAINLKAEVDIVLNQPVVLDANSILEWRIKFAQAQCAVDQAMSLSNTYSK